MAKQSGIMRLRGRIGDFLFYKMGKDYFVRTTSRSNRKLKNAKGVKQANREFAHASQVAKRLRNSISHLLGHLVHGRFSSQLTGKLQRIMATDPVHPKGERQVSYGDVSLLKSLEFFKGKSADYIMSWLPEVEHEGSMMRVRYSDHINKIPPGATHYTLSLHALYFDEYGSFDELIDLNEPDYMPYIPYERKGAPKFFTHELDVHSVFSPTERPIMGLVLCRLTSYKFVNGQYDLLVSGTAMHILDAKVYQGE
ncbi:hypothetical protein [Penaeicola halotolerans]|uniref:hypothetical protein n=1 Tax=Penaeicola halotolerans TaxID=2793196 RepID=UPI001CF8E673|nr:hypothetical protein [Penaeicola halotolerans]